MELKDFTPNASWLKSPREGGILRRRTFSFFVDLFCILLTTRLLMASYTSFLKTFMYLMGEKSQYMLTSQMHKVELSVISVVFFGYFFLSYYMGNGKTPGKTLFRLRVVPLERPTELLSLSESFKRTIGYFFCYVTGFVLFAIPFFNKKRNGIPDLFSSSQVLTEDQYKAKIIEQKSHEELGTQLELDFDATISEVETIIYLPGPEYYSQSKDDDKKAA
jgi:uncharacterized RDD family membrane protein YckC